MISGIFTSVAFVGFLAVSWWAYTRRNRARFEEASRLVLDEDQQGCGSAECCCRPHDTGAKTS
jgi:cbb3-type cytochrome oxidase subunit 3